MIEINEVAASPDFENKEEKIIQEHKEKKAHRKFRNQSANLHSKKQRRQNISPIKGQNQSPFQNDKNFRQTSYRSLSAKKPGLPQIFQEQRNNSNSLLPISAICWSVTDVISGQQLYSKMSQEVREMASLTKMMTLYVCHQLSIIYNLNPELEEIIVPRIAAQTGGTSAFLCESEKLSLRNLYHALMLPSGNDAAVTLANHFGQLLLKNPLQIIKVRQQITSSQLSQQQAQNMQSNDTEIKFEKQESKEQLNQTFSSQNQIQQLQNQTFPLQNQVLSQLNQKLQQDQNLSCQQSQDQRKTSQGYISRFVKEMNKYAQKLGMRDSQFSNPHGLASKSNRSTCEDLSKVAVSIIKSSELLQVCSTKTYQCMVYNTNKKELRKAQWINTNKLLWDPSSEFYGVKTGCTDNAGPCLCVYYKDKQNINIELITIVLCCKDPGRRFEDSSNLARWAARQLKQQIANSQIKQNNAGSQQNKFTFYNPQNIYFNSNFQRSLMSKNIFSNQVSQLDNSSDKTNQSPEKCDKITIQEEQSDKTMQQSLQTDRVNNQDEQFEKVSQQDDLSKMQTDRISLFGRTVSSVSQLSQTFNTRNIQSSNSKTRAGFIQQSKQSVSCLFNQNECNRINKFINTNINQIQDSQHHFNVSCLINKEEQDLTQRDDLSPLQISRGNSERNKSSLSNIIQRDRSAKSFNQTNNNKNHAINQIKRQIDDKMNLIINTHQKNKKKIIPQIDVFTKNNLLSNTKNNLTVNTKNSTSTKNNFNMNQTQATIQSSSQSTSCPTTSGQQSFTNKHFIDNISTSNDTQKNDRNINYSSLAPSPLPFSFKDENIGEDCAVSSQTNLSPSFSSTNVFQFRQDQQNNQLNILLKGGIQYRQEIRESIKKPIGGGTNSNIAASQSCIQSLDKIQGGNEHQQNDEQVKLNNFGMIPNNNNNHNIKIFSKSKKKRYIISCLANIN